MRATERRAVHQGKTEVDPVAAVILFCHGSVVPGSGLDATGSGHTGKLSVCIGVSVLPLAGVEFIQAERH